MKKTISLLLVLVMILGMFPMSAMASEEDIVYLSIADEGRYITAPDGKVMAYYPIKITDLKSIDLADYNLADYRYDPNGGTDYQITALHLYIYVHDKVLDGDWMNDMTLEGTPGSFYMKAGVFGFDDENLTYYLNGDYPGGSWGLTADQIVLNNGDFIDVAHYSNFQYYYDPVAGYLYFLNSDDEITFDNITHAFDAIAGEPLTVQICRTTGGLGFGTAFDAVSPKDYIDGDGKPLPVYYSTTMYDEAASTAEVQDDGTVEITFPEAGTYYLWADGGFGCESVVSCPAYAKVTVTGGSRPVPTPEYTVTLPSGTGFTAAAANGSASPVTEGGSFSFAVNIEDGYEKGDDFTVTANGTELTADGDGVYTISNITVDVTIAITGVVAKENEPELNWEDVMAATQAYLTAQAEERSPIVSSTSGEWQVLGLARAGVSANEDYFDEYYTNVVRYLDNNIDTETGRLDPNKSTDNSRVILALTSIGRDVTDVGGYNLLQGLSDINYVGKQGINGTVFALIALDSHAYEIPTNSDSSTQTIRELLIERILAAQYANGKWPIMDDMTPMALQALAPYKDQPAVAEAIEKAINAMELSMMDTSETYAQMVVQLSALDMDAAEFMLNGKSVLDRMLEYYVGNGAFAHAGTAANQMATEQAFYALVAYNRYKSGNAKTLYDMTDVMIDTTYEAADSVSSVTLDKSTLEVKAERNKTLIALVDPTDAKDRTVTWTSTDPTVVTVSSTGKISAKVTGVSAGTATITATVGGKTATCEVTVTGNENNGNETQNPPEENTITVTMRLIGAELAEQDIDLSKSPAYLPNYVTWIPTTVYTLEKGATVEDLWVIATEDADIDSIGAENNYVKTVYAPSGFGGYELSEFTNGARSGWMYTIGGRHPGFGLSEQVLSDGDVVIWHYVNDYAWEVEDWSSLGGSGWPQQSTSANNYWNRWLMASDSFGSKGGGIGSPNGNSGDEDDVAADLEVSVSGNKATVDKVVLPESDITGAASGNIVLDFSEVESSQPITTVAIPNNIVKQIADASGEAQKLEIVLSSGAAIELDAAALNEKAAKSGGSNVTVSLDKSSNPNAAQKEAVGSRPAYDIKITSGGKNISDMGKTITVHVPYTLKSGEKARGIVVCYVDDQGNKERCVTSYDPIKKRVNWNTDHLSLYMIDYDETLANNPFSDVSMENYYFDAVLWAVDEGITNGTSATTFSPDAACTRAQMVTFLWRAAGSPEAKSTTCVFTDVDKDAYYYEALLWAVENGITNGTSATTFSPDASCTRGQMATFLYRNAKVPVVTGTHSFTDVKADAYYNDAVIWAAAESITNGTSATTFSPDADCTRGQMVTFLYRYLAE